VIYIYIFIYIYMPSKTLNKRKRLRGAKNATKKTKKHTRKYLGGGKYNENDNFYKAYRAIYSVDAPTAAVHWLKEFHKEHKHDSKILELIDNLEHSGELLDDAKRDMEKLNDYEGN